MKKILAWLQASRLASQTYILFPIMFGSGLVWQQTGEWSWVGFWLSLGYSFLMQLFIVYANDYADADLDLTNSTFTIFSGGSRVLAEGKLSRQELGIGALVTLILGAGLSVLAGLVYGKIWLGSFFFLGWGLLWAYSFPPFRFSYQGGGEWLQTLGVALVLPLAGYYLQAGTLKGFPYSVLLFILVLHYAAAVVTALPDEPSDRAGGKSTLAVQIGVGRAVWRVLGAYGVAFLFLAAWVVYRAQTPWLAMLFILPALGAYAAMFYFRANAQPGTARLNGLVAAGVAVTVLGMLGLAAALLFTAQGFWRLS
jgi:1,4-dihydroxy-2-naphthoate octaprenyltransferase